MIGKVTMTVMVRRMDVVEMEPTMFSTIEESITPFASCFERMSAWRKYIPLTYGGKQRDRGKDGNGQGKDDRKEPADHARAVDLSGFLKRCGDGLHVGFDEHHIVYADEARYDVNRKAVQKAKGADVHIARNEAGAEIHGYDDQAVPQLVVPHVGL